MVNREILAIAKLERDARNFFFVKMLYCFKDSEKELKTVYDIEDNDLIDNLVSLSYTALTTFRSVTKEVGCNIIIYDIHDDYRYYGYHYYMYQDCQFADKIITGTMPTNHFKEINYLVHMLSCTMKKHYMGDFFVQYENKLMTEKEFLKFQDELSI